MKSLISPFIFALSINLFAADTSLTDQEKIILNEMSKSVGITLEQLDQAPNNNNENKIKEEVVHKEPIPTKEQNIDDQNSGKSIVERLKEKNRQKIKEQQNRVDAKNLGLDEEDDKEEDLVKRNLKFRESLQKKVQDSRSLWRDKIQETRNLWEKKREDFLKHIKEYKNTSFSLEDEIQTQNPSEVKKILERNKKRFTLPTSVLPKKETEAKKISTPIVKNSTFHIIPGALDLKVRDQGKRPTCASFAGLRALEILLVKEAPYKKLSEQYFYYSSKPQCKQSPCAKKGSWVNQGYITSQNSVTPDIPLEDSCPYQKNDLPSNQTHIPLNRGCQQGYLKVTNFHVINEREIMSYLNNNYPVIVGLKLNPSFYDNQGFVGLESKGSSSLDSHADGHAIVLIGHMKIPKEKVSKEGEYCFIASNSWGEGWGLGGHTCLSQNWLQQHLIKGAITSPISISYL